MYDLILKNCNIVNENTITESDIAIKDSRIELIASSINVEAKKTIDVNYPDLVMDKNINSSIKGVSLNDVLVIRNWLSYADIIGDDTYKSICNQKFQSNFLIKKLKLKSLDKV